MKRQVVIIAGALILAGGLAGCGKVGQLERPGPLFGAGRHATADADKTQPQQDPTRPVETVDPRDRSTEPAPSRTLPIPGDENRGATQPAPPGVLPDPYANPR
jgi:hypothetical protein